MANTLTVDTFLATGTWTAPTGVTSVTVECWGAGGGGTTGVGGGGGGEWRRGNAVAVTPGNNYAVAVGVGVANVTGTPSSFNVTTVVANGGLSGALGGTGGTGGTGDVGYNGGNGYVSAGTSSGGGGAGDSADGTSATGGSEYSGGAVNGGVGSSGTGKIIAAGGASSVSVQRAGARGEVRITYNIAGAALYPNIVSGLITDELRVGQVMQSPCHQA